MKVLITGTTGYLGGYVLTKLLEEPRVEITLLLRPGASITSTDHNGLKMIYCDLTNVQSLKMAFNDNLEVYDVIYHVAAGTSGSHYELMMNTVVATDNLLKTLMPTKIKRFVLVSSFSIYQMSSLSPWDILDENCPVETNLLQRDGYSATKTKQEKIVIDFCKLHSIPLVIVRPGKIYGPKTHVIPPQLGLNIPGVCFMVMGGNHVIPLTHVENCADAVILAGKVNLPALENVVNIVDDGLPTQKSFLKMYKNYLGPIPKAIKIPDFGFRIFVRFYEALTKISKGNIPAIITKYRADNLWKPLRYDNSKAKSLLSWKPLISTNKGLQSAFEDILNENK